MKRSRRNRLVAVLLCLLHGCAGAQAADCANRRKPAAIDERGRVSRRARRRPKLIAKKKTHEAIEKLTKLADSGSRLRARRWSTTTSASPTAQERLHERGQGVRASARARTRCRSSSTSSCSSTWASSTSSPASTTKASRRCRTTSPTPARRRRPRRTSSSPTRCREASATQEALPQIDLALSKAKAPKETWLQMKLAINYELKDFKACAASLVQLIGLAPDQAGLLEAAVQHVLRDEAGHRGGRGARAGGTAGFHRQAERDQESLQRLHDAGPAVQGRAAAAGGASTRTWCRRTKRTSSRSPTRGSMRANRRAPKPR